MKPRKKVLHPTDFTELYKRALRTALTLAQKNGARLILLHVQEPQAEGEFGVSPPEPEEEEILTELQRLVPEDLFIEVDFRVAYGNVAEEIINTASYMQCDLIVLAKHGERNFLTRWFHAIVAEHVIESAPCEVIAVGQPAYEKVA